MKNITDTQPATPFEKFMKLTERLLAVPKKEMDQKIVEYERKNTRNKSKRKGKR